MDHTWPGRPTQLLPLHQPRRTRRARAPHGDAPRRGPNRERARRAILAVLRRAERNQQRVGFTVTYADGTHRVLGGKGGYDPTRVLLGCWIEGQDSYAWLSTQLEGRAPGGVAVIGLDLDTWPAKPQAV